MHQTSTYLGSVRLGDHVVKIGSGYTPLGGYRAYQSSGIPFIRSQNVHMNRFEPEGLAYISEEQDAEMAGSRVCARDVLLNITGASIGRVCVAPDHFCPANVNQHVCVIRGDGTLDPDYLCLYFSSPHFQKFVWDSQAGATRQALTKGLIENLKIPLVELPEQQRIAARLREQLAEVESARKAVEEQLRAAEALPGAFIGEEFSNPPIHWQKRPLGEICEIVARQVDPRLAEYKNLPHVSGENMISGICKLINIQSASDDGMTSGKYLFEPGDVLYSKLRPYLRKAALAPFRGLCSADMYPIRVDKQVLDSRFATWMFVSEPFTKYAVAKSERSRMPKLNRQQLFSWICPLPSLDEQKAIADKLECCQAGVEHAARTIREKLTYIEKLPAALLREAFTGAK